MSARFLDCGKAADLAPGTMRRVACGSRRVLLANVEGRICAVDDTCTHEDASLSTGVLRGAWVRCPLHGSRFHVCTGEVLDEPAEVPLATYPVRLEGGRILVGVPEGGEP
ncbi:MAG TPA: non-heme iron oxygenase ferredoxin subunit [Myxococcota bacterium]|nr:non-heme iron oxygenase ferredoxin subunit [Myxococcota bacterium]